MAERTEGRGGGRGGRREGRGERRGGEVKTARKEDVHSSSE